ncbi:MAG: S41 family peptidase [Bacilli bacterium]|nr:S41 family peptidase [Bacilli bacterium]
MRRRSSINLKGWKILNKSFPKTKVKEKSSFSLSEVITAVLVTAVVSILVGYSISNSTSSKSFKELSPEMQEFLSEYNNIKDNYYGDIDEKVVLNEALQGVISKLGDPYTNVIDSDFDNSLNTTLNGSFEGLGVSAYSNNDGYIEIYYVIDNSPASKAGLKPRDVILSMNGKSTKDVSVDDFSKEVRNSKNENLVLEVSRDNNVTEYNIKRERVVLESVASKVIEKDNKKIGYIYIGVFAANTGEQFVNKLNELKDIDSLIIDVRSNTGGHLNAAVDIMNSMLDKTHVIYQIENKKKITKYYSKGKKTFDKPVVILTDGVSASASEMITACFKENLDAKTVGEKTFGKGTVQDVLYTTTGIEYKITTSKWLTPKGNWINEKGIEPDYKVKLSQDYLNDPKDENDNQLQKAIEVLVK